MGLSKKQRIAVRIAALIMIFVLFNSISSGVWAEHGGASLPSHFGPEPGLDSVAQIHDEPAATYEPEPEIDEEEEREYDYYTPALWYTANQPGLTGRAAAMGLEIVGFGYRHSQYTGGGLDLSEFSWSIGSFANVLGQINLGHIGANYGHADFAMAFGLAAGSAPAGYDALYMLYDDAVSGDVDASDAAPNVYDNGYGDFGAEGALPPDETTGPGGENGGGDAADGHLGDGYGGDNEANDAPQVGEDDGNGNGDGEEEGEGLDSIGDDGDGADDNEEGGAWADDNGEDEYEDEDDTAALPVFLDTINPQTSDNYSPNHLIVSAIGFVFSCALLFYAYIVKKLDYEYDEFV